MERMTDRFYPIPAAAEPATVMPGMASRNIGEFHKALYKTSYTSMNQMQTFPRSDFPPGYAGHQPGIRDKFGYGSPGPESGVLARPESSPGLKSLQQTRSEDLLDGLWSEKQGEATPKKGGDLTMSGLTIAPGVQRKSKIAALASKGIVGHMEDGGTAFFVPDSMSTWAPERVTRSMKTLSKLDKQRPLTGGFGVGTGFNSQKPGVTWWPLEESSLTRQRSVYKDFFKEKPYHPKSGFFMTVR